MNTTPLKQGIMPDLALLRATDTRTLRNVLEATTRTLSSNEYRYYPIDVNYARALESAIISELDSRGQAHV